MHAISQYSSQARYLEPDGDVPGARKIRYKSFNDITHGGSAKARKAEIAGGAPDFV